MDHYAFLLFAMSMEDARALLGFPPGSHPSDDEVRKAQRRVSLSNHPDRGGDPAKMVEINAAADLLLGKQPPTYDRRPGAPDDTAGPGYGAGVPHGYKRDERKPVEVTFQDAATDAHVPSDVEWVFITDTQRGTSYSSDEFQRSDYALVAYGRTSSKHVFVGMHYAGYQENYIGGAPPSSVWNMKVVGYPIQGDEGNQPAWLYGNVVKTLRACGSEAKFNSKVIDATGWAFGEKFPRGSSMSIKHLLVSIGAVADDDPRVQNRKHVIEIEYRRPYGDSKNEPGIYEIEHGSGSYSFKEHEGVNIVINTKKFQLDEADITKLVKTRLGGKRLLDAIFGERYYDGSKKNVSRMRDGKKLLAWMAENLTSLPQAARDVLGKAAQP